MAFLVVALSAQSTITLPKGHAPFFFDQNASGTFIATAPNKAGNASKGTWSFIKVDHSGKKKWETKLDIRDPRAYDLGDAYRYMTISAPDGKYHYLVLTGLRDYYAHQFDANGKHKVVEPLKALSSNQFSVEGLYATSEELIYLIRPLSSYQKVFLFRMNHKTGESKVGKIELSGPNFLVGINTGASWSASDQLLGDHILLYKYRRKNKETKVEMCKIDLGAMSANASSITIGTFGDNQPILTATPHGLTVLEYDKASVRYTLLSAEGKKIVSNEIPAEGLRKLSEKYNSPNARGFLLNDNTVAFVLEHTMNVYSVVVDVRSGRSLSDGYSSTKPSKIRTYRWKHGLKLGLATHLNATEHSRRVREVVVNKSDKSIPFYFLYQNNENSIIWSPKLNVLKISEITPFKQLWK